MKEITEAARNSIARSCKTRRKSAGIRPCIGGKDPRETGVALVLVLWVLVLLTTIAMSLVTTTRMETTLAGNIRGEREARALVDAGIQFQILQLLKNDGSDEDGDWPADGEFRTWTFAGRDIQIRAVPESARIDLNAASPELLEGLMRAIGLGDDEALALADRIVDWRDRDSDPRANGAEDQDYRSAGLPYGARDGKFETVGELQQVLGVDRRIYLAVAPALTVHSRRRTVNPIYASPLVLASIPGMDSGSVEDYLAARSLNGTPESAASLPEAAEKRHINAGKGGIYRVSASVLFPEGGVSEGEVIMTRSRQNKTGYKLLESDYNPLNSASFSMDEQPGQVE